MEKSAAFSIEYLKSYREGKRLEVKSAKGGLPNSLWETYSAFANSDGGVIVLGVKEREDGSLLIEGLKDAHKLLKDFWNMVNNRQNTQSKGESKGERGAEVFSKGKGNGERVISLLKSNGELTLPEVAQILNLSLGGIEKIVRQLKRDGILAREGSTKAGRWIVKD